MASVAGRRRATSAPAAPRRRRVHGIRVANGVVWILVVAVVLAGVVAVNVAVLRLNLRLDHLNQQRAKLREQSALTRAQLSHSTSSGTIEGQAASVGLVPADSTFIQLDAQK